MQIHYLRENESIDDLSILYSVDKNKIIEANQLKDGEILNEGRQILIPCDDFYYFKRAQEKIESVLNKFNITKEELYSFNKSPVCFKDGYVRLKIYQKKKPMKVYSFIDLNMGSNCFIEADLESEYVNSFVGYNLSYDENDDIEDFYLKKINEVENREISIILHNKVFNSCYDLLDFINKKVDKKYYKEINLYYDITNIDLDEMYSYFYNINLNINIILDINLLKKISNNMEIIEKINKYFFKIFIIPSFINEKINFSSEEYKLFLEKLEIFKKEKIVVGVNLNDKENINLMELTKIISMIYDKNISSIALYSCSNRYYKIKYILNHFFV